MNIKIKKIIKKVTPPILLELFKRKKKYGFFGNFSSWQEAKCNSIGYDSPDILEKVKKSLLQVKNGTAVYERDSVIFEKVQYSWPVLAGLLWIASKNNNNLNILDFGGSLGSSYFQNKGLLSHLSSFQWNIVEQDNFVRCGKKYFEDSHLKFWYTVGDCLKSNPVDVFFASSSLQYIEDPYRLIGEIVDKNFGYIILDRTTFLENDDRITVQKVRPGIYDASYPAWFINEKKLLGIIQKRYEVVADFDSLMGKVDLGDIIAFERGYVFKRKDR